MTALTVSFERKRRGASFSAYRRTTFLLCMFFLFYPEVYCAEAQTSLSLRLQDVPLEQVLSAIETQTSYRFLYNKDRVDVTRRVSIDVQNKELPDALSQLFVGTDITYTLKNKQIVLTRLPVKGVGPDTPVKTISGIVRDERGEPVIGANIIEKGVPGNGTITDVDGMFSLSVPDKAILVVSYIGYLTQEVPAGGANMHIVLKDDTKALEEVVVVGYGVQKKVNLTGAVSSVSGDEMIKRPVTNPTTMLQGQMPGVRIVQGLGQPGNESTQIRVRGQGTYSNAGSDPLVLIDGIPGSLSKLNANDIENISVLKDAASASIYGARAANGVVLVTTKTGRDRGFKINYNANWGIHTPTKMLKVVVNSAEYMELFNEAKKNSGISTGLYTQEMIDTYRNATDRVKYPNFDWLDYMFNPALVQNHSLSLNGGNKGVTYNITMGYIRQPGTMKGFHFDKYNFRVNVKSNLKEWITVGVNIALEKGDQKNPRQNHDDAFLSTLSQAPTYMPFLPDGKYVNSAYDFESHNKNMVAIVENDVLRKTTDYDVSSQIWTDIQVAKGLSWYSKMAINLSDISFKDWRPVVNTYNYHTGKFARTLDVGGEGLIAQNSREYYTNFFTYLKYDFCLNNTHHFGLQGGYSYEYDNYQFLRGYRQKYVTNNLLELNAGATAVQNAWGNTTEWALRSYFGRLNYNYRDRYLLEANIRYDGTSRIARDFRWGAFPSFSGAWRITEEDFIKKNQIYNWLKSTKLRFSYGLLGNQNIYLNNDTPFRYAYPYPYQDLLNFTGDYTFDNNTLSPGVAQSALANPALKWESTAVTDVGIDLQLFGKLNITYDWYRKHTYDILRQAQVTGSLGLGAPFVNGGDMLNLGHELSIQYSDRMTKGIFSGLEYSGGFYIDLFKNKLLKFGSREISGYVIRENDLPYNSFYMLEAIGIFQTQEEIDNSPKQFSGEFKPGDLKYRDVNQDGVINNEDRTIIPGRFPKFEYSFNGNVSWKGIDLSFLFQGVQGRRIYTEGWGLEPFIQGAAPTLDYVKNRWTGPGTSNEYPRIYFGWEGTNPNRRPSTWFLQDASFLRLKNLTIGYTLPQSLLSKMNIEKIRLYFSGDNLLTFTQYKGLDPERAGDGRFVQYPQNKIVSFGINVEF